MAAVATDGLGTAELEGAAHKVFAAEFGDSTAGFFDRTHGDKGEAFGTLRAIIHHDFRIAYAANAIEELKEVALRGVIGEIADVKSICIDGSRIDGGVFTTWATGLTRRARCGVAITAWWAWTATCVRRRGAALSLREGGGLTEQAKGNGAQEFLKTGLLRDATAWGGRAATGVAAALVVSAWAAIAAAIALALLLCVSV